MILHSNTITKEVVRTRGVGIGLRDLRHPANLLSQGPSTSPTCAAIKLRGRAKATDLLGVSTGCGRRSPRGSSWPLIISAIPHRCAPLFEVFDLSTEKGDTDIGGLNFRRQPRSHLFAGLRFWANYRCSAFLHNFRDAGFQERSQQWDHSLRCVL